MLQADGLFLQRLKSSLHTVCLEAPCIQPNQLLAACSRFSLAAAAAALFFSRSTCTAQAKATVKELHFALATVTPAS